MNLLRKKNKNLKVEIYSKPDCCLCDDAKTVILKVQKQIPFDFGVIDISQDKTLFGEFKEQIPVVLINGRKAFKFRVDENTFRRKLQRLSGIQQS